VGLNLKKFPRIVLRAWQPGRGFFCMYMLEERRKAKKKVHKTTTTEYRALKTTSTYRNYTTKTRQRGRPKTTKLKGPLSHWKNEATRTSRGLD
jgi:hypothetical protein